MTGYRRKKCPCDTSFKGTITPMPALVAPRLITSSLASCPLYNPTRPTQRSPTGNHSHSLKKET
ncbi:hypothetical protein E2C01_009468 [Portunus trituberculatus]|uniref:Uncharacterized protein n=1 Tax=Portunus trituberculatus TaxID=210409 RepID=A0A5B7D5V6_PORTR|nr:hypothetical protein [Portunus trituberculatus]